MSADLRAKINDKKEKEEGGSPVQLEDRDNINASISFIKQESSQMNIEKDAFCTESGFPIFSKLKVSLGYSGIRASNISLTVKIPEVFS